jgi:hypothetical protein
VQIFVIKQRGTLMPVRTAAPAVSKAVAAVVHRALALDPAARYGSCGGFLRALTAACDSPSKVPPEETSPAPKETGWAAKDVTLPLRGKPDKA